MSDSQTIVAPTASASAPMRLARVSTSTSSAVATPHASKLGSKLCIIPSISVYAGWSGPAPITACADSDGEGSPAVVKVECNFIPISVSEPDRSHASLPQLRKRLKVGTGGYAWHPDQSA